MSFFLQRYKQYGHRVFCNKLIISMLQRTRFPTLLKNRGAGTEPKHNDLNTRNLSLVPKPGTSSAAYSSAIWNAWALPSVSGNNPLVWKKISRVGKTRDFLYYCVF